MDDKLQTQIDANYEQYTLEEQKKLHEIFINEAGNLDTDILKKLKLLIYKKIPPTAEEFLDHRNGWLPKKVCDSIYPHIKEDFIDFIDNNKKYFQAVLYGGTRLGKSFLSQLLIIYTIVYIHHLRSPALFYGLSPLTKLAIYMISFKFDKTRQLYLKDIYAFMEHSDKFVKVKFQDKVAEEQEQYGTDKIVWSKAALSGEITLASGLQILLGNDNPNEIIGANILQCYVSEIAFFIDEAGASEDSIFELYSNAYDRIDATVGNDMLSYVLLDSSANYADSKIEKHIINTLQYQDDVFFRWRARWESSVQKLPKWKKTGETFQVITGNGNIPAQLVTDPRQLTDVPKDLILDVPIDLKRQFELNLVKSIKDIAGRPTSNESKFIQDVKLIDNIFRDETIRNIEGGVVIDAKDSPTQLVWNQIQHIFFNKVHTRHYFWRAPNEPRWIATDTAHSSRGDLYGFCMGHMEWSRELDGPLCILDMAFPFMPGDSGINLTAVEYFIKDLKFLGNVHIQQYNTDSFQSAQTKQNLERVGINASILSVDTTLTPYIDLLTALNTDKVLVGKNIFLRNNLHCLERTRKVKKNGDLGDEKIDHPKGITTNKYTGDWKNSTCGLNAKDVADTVASVVHSALSSGFKPSTIYEDENRKFSGDEKDKEEVLKEAFHNIMKTYKKPFTKK